MLINSNSSLSTFLVLIKHAPCAQHMEENYSGIKYLLETELRVSAFLPLHWLARDRLSVHISAEPNMAKEHVNDKASSKLEI